MNSIFKPFITVGMATFDDSDGVYFTVQALRLYHSHLMNRVELIVVDNNPGTQHSTMVRELVQQNCHGFAAVRYVPMIAPKGTSPSRNQVFVEATAPYVLCMDCHVLLWPGALDNLIKYYEKNPGTRDIISGPMIYDGLRGGPTHFDNVWRNEMWGTWGAAWRCTCDNPITFCMTEMKRTGADGKEVVWTNPHEVTMDRKPVVKCNCGRPIPIVPWCGHEEHIFQAGFVRLGVPEDKTEEPFEIPGQGLGLFTCAKDAWLGFHQQARSFGGEELYIHEKFRKAGHKALCLPQLRWVHRFGRIGGVPYDHSRYQMVRNYVMEFRELGMDIEPIRKHFQEESRYPLPAHQWHALMTDPFKYENEPQRHNVPNPVDGKPVKQERNFLNIDDIFNELVNRKRDLNEHMVKLRELAGQVKKVVEISNRRDSTVAFLASGTNQLTSFNTEVCSATLQAIEFSKFRTYYTNTPESDSSKIPEIPKCDLLFIDSEHTYARLLEELKKYAPSVSRYIVVHDTDIFGMKDQKGEEPGLLQAMADYMREHPEWSVVYHTRHQYGLTVLSRLPADKPPLPSKLQMAGSFLAAVGKHVLNGLKEVTEEQLDQRLLICSSCIHRNGTNCSVCGCDLEEKAAMACMECPLMYWKKVEAQNGN